MPTFANVPTLLSLKVDLIRGAYLEDPFSFELQILTSSTLHDLHRLILDAVGFDCDHLFYFYASRTSTSRNKLSFTEDEYLDEGMYSDVLLSTVYPLPDKLKLYYLFDFGDHWLFQISRTKEKPAYNASLIYPRAFNFSGIKPCQYPEYGE